MIRAAIRSAAPDAAPSRGTVRPACTSPGTPVSPQEAQDSAMLIAFAAAASLSPAAPQEHAQLHPATSAITIQIPDVQGLIGAYSKTAYARMLADKDLHEAIGVMMAGEGADPVDPLALAMAEYHDQVASGQMPPLLDLASGLTAVSMSVDVPNGDMFAFIQAAEQPRDDEGDFAVENMGIRIVADFVDVEAREKVSGFFSEMLASEAPRNNELQALNMGLEGDGGAWGADAVTVWRYEPTGDEQYSWTAMERSTALLAGGKRMALCMGNTDAADFAELLAAGTQEQSAAALFAAGRKPLGAQVGTTVFEAHINPFVEQLLMKEAPEFVPALDLVEGLFGSMASMFIRGGHWRFDLDGEGQFHLAGVHAPSAAGPTAGLLGAQPLDATALSLAHPDALVTTVTSLDKNVLTNMITNLAAQEDPEALAQIDEAFGFRPDRDLAAPLGSSVSYSLPKLGSLIAAPNLMIALDLDDQETFLRGMDGLFRMITATTDEVLVARAEYKKISTLYTMSFPDLFGDMSGMGLPMNPAELIKPTIAVLGDRIVITTNKSHAKKEVRRVRKLLEAAGEPVMHAGIAGLGDLKGAATVSYADWAGFVGGIYSQVKAFGPMLAGAGLPVDVTALPEADVFTRHFKPSERRVRIMGDSVVHTAASSFGPEFSALFPIAMGGGVFAARSVAQPMMIEAVEAVPMEEPVIEDFDVEGDRTTDALVQVSVALTLYQLDNDDAVPATLADLTKAAANYPKGYLEGTVPTDAWGNALVYKAGQKSYTLYSMGANGADDGGQGDDILGD